VLQQCDDQAALNEAEKFWIVHLRTHCSFKTGYNIKWGGGGGGQWPEEWRRRHSEQAKARGQKPPSTKGLKHDATIRKHMSDSKKKLAGTLHRPLTIRKKQRNPAGPKTAEHKAKMRAASLKRKRDAYGMLLPGKVT